MDREEFRGRIIEYQCTHKCMGHVGNSGGCCTLGDRDFIIGPIRDGDAFLARLSASLGRPVAHAEVFVDFEEGRQLFPERPCWQDPAHFPALRVDPANPRTPCRFYDVDSRLCTVHAIRPGICRSYECAWLKEVLDKAS